LETLVDMSPCVDMIGDAGASRLWINSRLENRRFLSVEKRPEDFFRGLVVS
jgi:hypothetical protein